MIRAIAHITDFSRNSETAFVHALSLSLAYKSRLFILHVKHGREDEWSSFPHVREILARWGLMRGDEPTSQIENKAGITVAKVEIYSSDIAGGIERFLSQEPVDILVVATQGREGLRRLVRPSTAEEITRRTQVPTLFINPGARGFVDVSTGQLSLQKILVPIAHTPSPMRSLSVLIDLLSPLGISPRALHMVHVGSAPPNISRTTNMGEEATVELLDGDIEQAILKSAREHGAELIAMPTAGRDGFMDAIRGSTTERILHHAPCPLFAISAG